MAFSRGLRPLLRRPLVPSGCHPRLLLHGAPGRKDSIIEIPAEAKLPDETEVVIAGSGLIGNAVAYHLVERGWKNIIVIDKNKIADGTSKHGSGMLGMFRPSHERRIVQYCVELYRNLQDKGFDIGLKECGSLNLAMSKDRMISLRRRANRYKPTGLECHVLDAAECREKHPYLYTEDLQGGVWIPGDATVHPKKVSEALAFLAYSKGVRFVEHCGVQKVLTEQANQFGPSSNKNIKVSGVETDKGTIKCKYFVNCAGIWARHLGKLSDPPVRVPIGAVEHFFVTFTEIEEFKNRSGEPLPNVRDYDNHIYFRSWNNSVLMGAFERVARPWKVNSESDEITEEHWTHMANYLSAATRRLPILKEAEYDCLVNTPDAFTPDGRWILGETPEVGNYYVCAGMNGNSLQVR